MTDPLSTPRIPDPEVRMRYLAALHHVAVELHASNAELRDIEAAFQRQFEESPIGRRQAKQRLRTAANTAEAT